VGSARVCESAAIGRCRSRQAEPKQLNKVHGGAGRVRSAAQITQAIEPLDGQRQAREQPSDQQAVCVMMTDMLQIMAILGVIEPLVFDFPPALGAVK
jgi:hypothetical protein